MTQEKGLSASPGTADAWSWMTLCHGGSGGLHPLHTPPALSCDKNVSDVANCSLAAKLPPFAALDQLEKLVNK